MFVIQIQDVAKILYSYNCDARVITIDMLSYYQQENSTCMVISAETLNNNKYVIKFLDCRSISKDIEEKQSLFSEYLRIKGIKVPRKYKKDNDYCTIVRIDTYNFYVTVEDYFGTDVTDLTVNSANFLGENLGRMHEICLSEKYHLDMGYVFLAIKNQKTNFCKIWEGINNKIIDNDYLLYLKHIHNQKMNQLKILWDKLPKAAVHGDLGLTKNIVYYKLGYGIIDFNLSGDAVLIGDFLMTWYSSIYNIDFIRKVSRKHMQQLKLAFFSGYTTNRKLSDIEIQNISIIAKIMNGTYFHRFVADIIKQGYIELGKKIFYEIDKNYELNDSSLDLNEVLTYEQI